MRGYRSHTIPPRSPEASVRYLAPALDTAFKDCQPLVDEALFLRFAGLECTEAAVVAFATKNGPLYSPPKSRDESGEPVKGERLEDWFLGIRRMKLGVRLWEASKQKSADAFRHEMKSHELARLWESAGPSQPSDLFQPNTPTLRHPSSYTSPLSALQAAQALALWELSYFGASAVKLSFVPAFDGDRYVLELGPDSLKSGLWMQFAAAMARYSNYRACAFEPCGGFIDATAFRKSKKFCTDSCRTMAYDLRKETEALKKQRSTRKTNTRKG